MTKRPLYRGWHFSLLWLCFSWGRCWSRLGLAPWWVLGQGPHDDTAAISDSVFFYCGLLVSSLAVCWESDQYQFLSYFTCLKVRKRNQDQCTFLSWFPVWMKGIVARRWGGYINFAALMQNLDRYRKWREKWEEVPAQAWRLLSGWKSLHEATINFNLQVCYNFMFLREQHWL